MAALANLVGAVSVVGRELRCPTNSGLVAKPALGSTLQSMRNLGSERLANWSLFRRGHSMAYLADLVGTVGMIGGELACPANTGFMAKPAVCSIFHRVRYLRGQVRRHHRLLHSRSARSRDVTGLTDINWQALVILGGPRRQSNPHLVAHEAFLTPHQIVRDRWRRYGRQRWLRKERVARRTQFLGPHVVAV